MNIQLVFVTLDIVRLANNVDGMDVRFVQLTNKSLNIFDVLVVLDDVGNNADTSPYTAARLVLF